MLPSKMRRKRAVESTMPAPARPQQLQPNPNIPGRPSEVPGANLCLQQPQEENMDSKGKKKIKRKVKGTITTKRGNTTQPSNTKPINTHHTHTTRTHHNSKLIHFPPLHTEVELAKRSCPWMQDTWPRLPAKTSPCEPSSPSSSQQRCWCTSIRAHAHHKCRRWRASSSGTPAQAQT